MMTATLMAVALEPAFTDVDLLKYGITQGGLVLVVLVILWSYRRDMTRMAEHDAERLAVLTNLVGDTRSALTQTTGAVDRLARALEQLEDRRERR